MESLRVLANHIRRPDHPHRPLRCDKSRCAASRSRDRRHNRSSTDAPSPTPRPRTRALAETLRGDPGAQQEGLPASRRRRHLDHRRAAPSSSNRSGRGINHALNRRRRVRRLLPSRPRHTRLHPRGAQPDRRIQPNDAMRAHPSDGEPYRMPVTCSKTTVNGGWSDGVEGQARVDHRWYVRHRQRDRRVDGSEWRGGDPHGPRSGAPRAGRGRDPAGGRSGPVPCCGADRDR